MIINLPISQIVQSSINPNEIIVIIDPLNGTDYDTIVDNENFIWLFPITPISDKNEIISTLREYGRL